MPRVSVQQLDLCSQLLLIAIVSGQRVAAALYIYIYGVI